MKFDDNEMAEFRRISFGEQQPKDKQQKESVPNGLIGGKEQEAAAAKASGEWFDFLNCHTRDYWPDLVESLRLEAKPQEWVKAVRLAWIFLDGIRIDLDKWRPIFSRAKGVKGLMTDAETATLEAQGDPVTVYRGCNEHNVEGLSWSLDPFWARVVSEASAVDEEPDRIIKGTANKTDVVAYFDENGEEKEIVVFPELVRGKAIHERF